MKVIGIDQATTSGFCLAGDKIDFADWTTGHFKAAKRPEEGDRLNFIYDSILGLIDGFEPDLLACESAFDPTVQDFKSGKERPQFNRSTMQFLQRIKGAVIMAAARRSIPVEEYQPRSWRVTLKLPEKPYGADSKWIKRETQTALARYGIKTATLDEADAAGIAFHALHGKAGIARATDDLLERMKATL